MTLPPSGASKLALDEDTFQQLLAAAYALQENKDVLQAGNSAQDSAAVFSEIAALRSKILSAPGSELPGKPGNAAQAAGLVAECLQRLTKADGASVCLIINGYLKCPAFAGTAVNVPGGSVASNSLVATERLRNGNTFVSANACSDIRLDPAQCVKLKIGSLLAVPITVKNDIAGLIELRWSKSEAFRDGDERICQLLVELMSEVMGGEAIQVNLPVANPVRAVTPKAAAAEMPRLVPRPAIAAEDLDSGPAIAREEGQPSDDVCRVCGKPLSDDLNFCGSCGMISASPDNGLQGKWASMWFMQQAQRAVHAEPHSHERLWPIERADLAAETPAASDDESASEASNGERRRPRGVLSVLKAQLRVRSGERKPRPS